MSPKAQRAKLLYWFIGFKEDPHELFNKVGVNSNNDILEKAVPSASYFSTS